MSETTEKVASVDAAELLATLGAYWADPKPSRFGCAEARCADCRAGFRCDCQHHRPVREREKAPGQ